MDIKKEDFCDRMMKRYPDLFPKDEEGNPCEPECGFGCPVAWEPIIETLLSSIDYHVKNGVQIQRFITLYKIHSFLYRKIIVTIAKSVSDCINPLGGAYEKNRGWISSTNAIRLREAAPIQNWIHETVQKFFRLFAPKFRWKKVKVNPVTIDQVKTKFGTLRFYYSGGDAHIRSIVGFAESLTYKI